MKKLLTASLILLTTTAANAISLCENAPVEACAQAIENFYVKTFTETHQTKQSPISKDQFSKSIKEAVGFDQFLNLYKKCTETAESADSAISCIHNGFTPLLIRKVGNKEVDQFIQKTLPDIVSTWDVEAFRKNAVSFFPMEDYPRVSNTANLLFGGCQVGNIEEKGRKFEMTHGLVMHDYVVNLTCQKIKDPEVELLIVNENGSWKYGRLDVHKRANINLNK